MRIGYFQFSPVFGNPVENRKRIEISLKKINADLIVLPELATSGYFFGNIDQLEAASETIPGPTTELLLRIAGEEKCFIVIGMPEIYRGKYYNTAVLIGPDGIVGKYRKVHLYNREKGFFTPGNSGFPIFEINKIKIGILICFDHMFPEAARSLALKGVQIICHPSNLVMPEYGQLTTRVRSIENRIFWILSNRTGSEQNGDKILKYTGKSQIISPDGNILTSSSEIFEGISIVAVDPSLASNKNINKNNNLFKDRKSLEYELS